MAVAVDERSHCAHGLVPLSEAKNNKYKSVF